MHTRPMLVAGTPCRVTRCGYTGEDGFELSIPKGKVREHVCGCEYKLLGECLAGGKESTDFPPLSLSLLLLVYEWMLDCIIILYVKDYNLY